MTAGVLADLIMVADVPLGEIELFKQSIDDFWVVLGHVGGFSNIFLQIVEREFLNIGAVILGDVGLPRGSFLGAVQFRVSKMELPSGH